MIVRTETNKKKMPCNVINTFIDTISFYALALHL